MLLKNRCYYLIYDTFKLQTVTHEIFTVNIKMLVHPLVLL